MEEGKPAEKMEKEKNIREVRVKLGRSCETTRHLKENSDSQEIKGMKTYSTSLIVKTCTIKQSRGSIFKKIYQTGENGKV